MSTQIKLHLNHICIQLLLFKNINVAESSTQKLRYATIKNSAVPFQPVHHIPYCPFCSPWVPRLFSALTTSIALNNIKK